MRKTSGWLVALAAVIPLLTRDAWGAAPPHISSSRALTFDERIAAQRAIEEVYWRHRIWPKDNLTAKPALDAVMPEGAIRAKVEDYLKKSNALETWWRRPITGEQLQAELDRMARGSRDTRVLQALFDALGNDAYLIAETLARPTLVERLARNWYVNDDRFHGPSHRKAEQGLAKCGGISCMKEMGGEYSETTATLRRDDDAIDPSGGSGASLKLDTEQWKRHLDVLASIPERRLGKLQETNDAFVVSAVLSRGDDEIVTATTRWPKRSFDAWWKLERTRQPTTVASTAHEFMLPNLSTGCTNDTWTPTFTDVPDGRDGHVAVWTGTEMIIWGGASTQGSSSLLNTGGRYNPATDSWTATSTGANVPLPAYWMTAVWTGTEMIVWGGLRFDLTIRFRNTGGRYDPANDSWSATSTGTGVPAGRFDHTAVWTGTEMIVWGGVGQDSPSNTGGRYNPSTDSWSPTSIGANVPTSRTGHTAIWTGTEMIVWSGVPASGPVQLGNSGGRYNPSSDTWSPTSRGANVPSPRSDHTAIWTGTEMIVWGGKNNEGFEAFVDTGGRYDPVTDSWRVTSTAASVPAARSQHTTVWTGSKMIIWGGSSGTWLDSGAVYDPDSDSWTATSASMLAGRSGYTAVWTGAEMIVWAGRNIGLSNSGGRYHPTTDTWVATSTGASVPQARTSHRSVWTGTEMIVWGGRIDYDLSNPTRLNSGGRYSPATDSWIPTSMGAGVPAPRDSHAVVWTGKEMIVWGGNGVTNSGGRYNPLTDSWVATSTGANVPSWRTYAMAVWTDSEMIVWGGFGYGGRYDPVTDSWRAMSTGPDVPAAFSARTLVWTGSEMITWGFDGGGRYLPSKDVWTAISDGDGAPTKRFEFTSVWTGAEMIVWGGAGGRPVGPFGGRYNPRTNTWTPTSSGANTASARDGHVANWTGSEMLVWGGSPLTLNAPDNGGGRYDPSTDTWVPISMGANAPSSRYEQTAVWTGTEMIVWGGEAVTSTGARYCAVP
jgi:N-acetylneuraminic acid mutarotase